MQVHRYSRRLWAALLAEFVGLAIFQIYGGSANDDVAALANGITLAVIGGPDNFVPLIIARYYASNSSRPDKEDFQLPERSLRKPLIVLWKIEEAPVTVTLSVCITNFQSIGCILKMLEGNVLTGCAPFQAEA